MPTALNGHISLRVHDRKVKKKSDFRRTEKDAYREKGISA